MRNLLVALWVALAFNACATAQTQKTFTITGYAERHYMVADEPIQRQFNAMVTEITSMSSQTNNAEISIQVVGSADQSGSSEKNQDWGLARAGQVVSFLSAKFPKAHIAPAGTNGDKPNMRMVVVTVTITPVAPSAPALFTSRRMMWIGIVALALLVWTLSRRNKTAGAPLKLQSPTQTQEEALTTPVRKAKWVEYESGRYSCEALITPHGNNDWRSPFTIHGKPIISSSERGIIKSLRGCMTNDDLFKDQRESLRADAKFRFKIKEGVAS